MLNIMIISQEDTFMIKALFIFQIMEIYMIDMEGLYSKRCPNK